MTTKRLTDYKVGDEVMIPEDLTHTFNYYKYSNNKYKKSLIGTIQIIREIKICHSNKNLYYFLFEDHQGKCFLEKDFVISKKEEIKINKKKKSNLDLIYSF